MADFHPSAGHSGAFDDAVRRADEYLRLRAGLGAAGARARVLQALAGSSAGLWLECGRALVLRGDPEAAAGVFAAALAEHPDDIELNLAMAGMHWQQQHRAEAETILEALLERHPAQAAAVFMLARLRKEQGRMRAAETVLRALFDQARQSTAITIQAIELLDECGRKRAAAEICEREIAAGSRDPRLHAYAGMLHVQLGDFARSRERYLFALENSPLAVDWEAANALASLQRYDDAQHPDFARFHGLLLRDDLSHRARASVLFALGKAYDDLGDVGQAARCLREANALIAAATPWSRKNWRRAVEARLGAKALPSRSASADGCVPIFIVGAPRSGTTLVAELLSRSPRVCNRGELAWLPFFAQQIARTGKPDTALYERIAGAYLAQLRQDDSDAHWFIDKQPLNVQHLDLIAALFPQARIIHCTRNSCDTALSIWMQHFAGPENAFAYDFANIAAVLHDVPRLVAHARRAGTAIHALRYEELVAAAATRIAALAAELGIPAFDATTTDRPASVISTSSTWQARQPVYTRAVGRWRAYAHVLPELLQFADD
ncbi:MAG TPA: sulfotransferase [Dokdonella sp.]